MKELFKHLLIIVLLVGICDVVKSQDDVKSVFDDDILFTEMNPLHPFGIFTLDRPYYFGTFKKKGSKFTVGYSMGNNWHPQSKIYYPTNLTAKQKVAVNNLYMTERPYYFYLNRIQTEHKTLSSDGVLQNLSFTYLLQMAKKGSFIFKLNTHWLSGGTSFVHHFASDDFIEWFHDQVNLHDNFGRLQYIFDRAHIEFEDENGKSIRIDKGEAFLGTFDIHYYKPLWHKEYRSFYHSFQLGSHLALPLNKYYPKVAGSISGALMARKNFGRKFYIDLGADFSVIHNSLISFGDAANIIDKTYRKDAKAYLAFSFPTLSNKCFSFGMINNYQDAFLNGFIFSDNQDKYEDLGVYYLQPGEVWEDFEVKEVFRHAKLTAASMYFFSIKTYFFIEYKWPRSKFCFNVGEDLFSVNNAPDIQYGFRYTRTLGK